MTSPPTKYKARPGAKNEGEDYEFEMTALLALRCVRFTKNVLMATNAEGVGDFDDIILMVTTDNDVRYDFLLQLKHKADPNDLTSKELNKGKGVLPVAKYCEHIVTLRRNLEEELPADQETIIKDLGTFDNLYFVYFTNRGMDMDKFEQNQFPFYELAKDDDQMPLLKSLLNTHHGTDCVFKFAPTNIPSEFSSEDADNFANFRIFTNQINLKDLHKEIAAEIKMIAPSHLLRTSEKHIADAFIKYVKSWANGELGRNYYLTKDEILFKLTELFLSQYEFPLRPEPFADYDSEKKNVWNELVSDKKVTTVDSDETVSNFMVQFLGNGVGKYCKASSGDWTHQLSNEQRQSFYEDHGHLQHAMLKTVTNNGEITLEEIYKCLWSVKKLPLLLKVAKSQEYDNILDILQLSDYSHSVIVLNCTSTPLRKNGDIPTFQTLQDLNADEKRMVLDQPAKLQGRALPNLGALLDDNMLEDMKSRDIIHLLSGTFSIGEKIASLPRYYIHRNTSKVFLKSQVLDDVRDDEIFFLNEPMASYPKESIITDVDQVEELKYSTTIHYCSSYSDDFLEWNRTLGTTATIRPSKVALNDVFQSDISYYFSNHTNIISEVPGMGKSVLMDHIAAKTPTTAWVLRVDLNKHLDYYRKLNPNTKAANHLNHFFNGQDNSLAKGVFEKLLSNKKVVVLLDGFDEISIAYTEQVTQIAKSLQKEGYHVWLTTRPHMKDHLEKTLNTFAITLQPFTADDQKKFLMDYFSDKNKELVDCKARLEEFVDGLLLATKKNLYDYEAEFTGIPLQTELLADYFQEKCRKCLSHSRPITFNKKFDLLDLYNNIVNKKVEGLDTKYSPAALEETDKCRKDRPLLSLQLVFQLEHFEEIDQIKETNEDYRKNPDKKQHLQRDGVITIDEKFNICCTHRTFAEFMAAQWLADNLNTTDAHLQEFIHDLIKQRFTKSYQFLFNIFDRILAQGCDLHMTIINKQLNKVKTVDSNSSRKLDEGGRTVLHVLALYDDQIGALEFIDKIPNVQKLISKRDRLGFTALDYALANQSSLALANALCARPNIAPINAYIEPSAFWTTLTKCQNHGLDSLVNLLVPYFASRDLLQGEQPPSTTMKRYLQKAKSFATNPGCIKISLFKTILDFLQTKQGGPYSRYAPTNDHYSDLRYAILFGTERNLEEVVSKCNDINQKDVDNNTPLHYAVISQNLKSVDLLLAKGANINKRNLKFHSPLHMAFDRRNLEIIKLLLSKNPNLNVSDKNGQNALHYAVKHGDYGIVKELVVKGGVDVNTQDNWGNIPLLLALQQSKMDIAELLFTNGSDINILNNENKSALYYVIRFDDKNVIDKNLFKNVDKNVQDMDGNTPLHLELKNNQINVDTVRFLIDTGADVNVQNQNKETPLHLALNSASLNGTVGTIIDLLLDHGANVNIKNGSDETAIHCAIKYGYADVVAVVPKLLSTLQDVNQQDCWGNTCLHLAAQSGQTEIAKYLVLRGAKLDVLNNKKETPLQLATTSGFTSTMMLLATGASINTIDRSGNTPFDLGVKHRQVRAVEQPGAKGANANTPNKGKGPSKLARGNGERIAAASPHGKGGKGTSQKKETTNNRRRARKNPTF